jgi:uncharacterized membrane protein YkvA (DUF1232 family)
MPSLEWLLVAIAIAVVVYALFVSGLFLLGRRTAARALAGFIPDCLVLLQRLLRDERLPQGRKLVLFALIAYLAMPIDLVPDFVPIAGQLDDVVVAALALRYALRSGGPDLLHEHWPGPEASLNAVLGLAYGRAEAGSARTAEAPTESNRCKRLGRLRRRAGPGCLRRGLVP